MRYWLLWVMLAASLSAWPSAADADRDSRITTVALPQAPLVVRVYDAGPRPPSMVQRALREAAQIVREGSIEVIWEPCARSNPARCDRPLPSTELALRLVSMPVNASYRGTLPLGNSLIAPGVQHGTLATVYVDRVEWLAAQSGADIAVLLGRTVAHEIGHLLIGTNHHATGGLMRARWSREELQRNNPADWRFTADDGVEMRRGMLARSGQDTPDALVWNRPSRPTRDGDERAAY